MAGFGIGLGAFASGFARGYGIRRQINADKRLEKKQKIEDAKVQAFTDARTDYDRDVGSDVITQAGEMHAAGQGDRFNVDSANAKAKERTGSFTEYVYQRALPKIIDTFVANGDIEGAEKLRLWGENAKERKFTEQAGKALNLFAAGEGSGDYEPFAKEAVKMLNNGGYPVKANSYEMVKDGDGKQTGITFDLQEGEHKYKRTFNSMQEVGQFFAMQADPRSRVKWLESQSAAADKFKTKIAEKRAEAQINLSKDVALEDHRQENRLQRDGAKQQSTRLDAERKADVLRGFGYGEDTIKKWMPALMGIRDDERQRMSSDDVIKFAMDTLSKNDFTFQRASQEQKQKMIDDFVNVFMARSDSISAKRRGNTQPGITGRPSDVPVLR